MHLYPKGKMVVDMKIIWDFLKLTEMFTLSIVNSEINTLDTMQ